MKSAFVILAAFAVLACAAASDADDIVPEMDNSVLLQDDTLDQHIEAYKAAVDESVAALNRRTQLAVAAKAQAEGEREEAQWVTAELMAHNDMLMTEMGGEYPVLMEVEYEPELIGTGTGSAKASLKKAEKELEKDAGKPAKKEKKEDSEDDKQKAAAAFAGDVAVDYGKCVTPPELSGLFTGGSAPLFGKIKQPAAPKKEEDPSESVGAIRTMCHDEIVEKGSYKEKDAKILEKTKATEVKAKESVSKAGAEATEKTKATAAIGAKEVTAKDKFNKIKTIANTHKTVQHVAHRAEKRVTIVQGGRDNAVEIKGKHQWQHQELVDKAGVEHSHKETAGKIDKLVKTVTGTKGPTIIKGGNDSKAAQQQLEAFKEFTGKENKQKQSETKTKVRTNEVLIKGGEKLGKKGTGKTVVVNKSPSAPAPAADHPDKEIAAKLIKQNSELTMKLQKVNIQVKSTPNDGAVIKVLKAQVKELQAKKTPKQTTIIKHTYPPPAPAPAPAPAAKKVIVITPAPVPAKPNCHKETKAKHPFANLEKNGKQIMKLKDGVERAQKGCESKAER